MKRSTVIPCRRVAEVVLELIPWGRLILCSKLLPPFVTVVATVNPVVEHEVAVQRTQVEI